MPPLIFNINAKLYSSQLYGNFQNIKLITSKNKHLNVSKCPHTKFTSPIIHTICKKNLNVSEHQEISSKNMHCYVSKLISAGCYYKISTNKIRLAIIYTICSIFSSIFRTSSWSLLRTSTVNSIQIEIR